MRNVPHTFRSIDVWPGKKSTERRRAPFRSSYNQTMDLLDNELWQLDARDVVIQIAISDREIRKSDGLPYATARPSFPGVILSFSSEKTNGPVKFPCDTFTDWESNLRAIALSLEALRKVDRYGVTRRAEQYQGWAKLPPPGGLVTPPPMTVEDAARYVAASAGVAQWAGIVQNVEQFRKSYRAGAMKLHPDTNDGSSGDWKHFQDAASVLRRHHNLTSV